MLDDALYASYDGEVDAYYFRGGCQYPSVKQIDLGQRQVILDVDAYGRVIGVEVL